MKANYSKKILILALGAFAMACSDPTLQDGASLSETGQTTGFVNSFLERARASIGQDSSCYIAAVLDTSDVEFCGSGTPGPGPNEPQADSILLAEGVTMESPGTVASQEVNEILATGQPVSLTGSIEIEVAEDLQVGTSELSYAFVDGQGTRHQLYFATEVNVPALTSGTTLNIEGKTVSEGTSHSTVVTNFTVESPAIASSSANLNLGEQKTLVILVNFQDAPNNRPYTVEQVRDEIFSATNPNSLDAFIRENSYHQTFLYGDILSWITLPVNSSSCNDATMRPTAIAAADPVVNFSEGQYRRVIILYPGGSHCTHGISTIGQVSVPTAEGNFQMSVARVGLSVLSDPLDPFPSGTIKHELSHGFGIWHANDLECGTQLIGTCSSLMYGDSFSTMGSSYYFAWGHLDAVHKNKIGWFSPTNVKQLDKVGTYHIEPIETQGNGLKAAWLPLVPGQRLFFEFRRPLGFDTGIYNAFNSMVPQLFNGLLVALEYDLHTTTTADSHLLDMSPHVQSSTLYPDIYFPPHPHFYDSLDAAFHLNKVLEFPSGGMNLRVASLSDAGIDLEVTSRTCGNRTTEPVEECDDGNLTAGDGCNARCETEANGIISSNPPDGAIDARVPHAADGSGLFGWEQVEITFQRNPSQLTPGDFTIYELGDNTGSPPQITSVTLTAPETLTLTLSEPLQQLTWTVIEYQGSKVHLGTLPGDVNGDGTTSPVDILHLVDVLNGIYALPIWSTDINRSNLTSPSDILALIDLLNGATPYEVYNGAQLPLRRL